MLIGAAAIMLIFCTVDAQPRKLDDLEARDSRQKCPMPSRNVNCDCGKGFLCCGCWWIDALHNGISCCQDVYENHCCKDTQGNPKCCTTTQEGETIYLPSNPLPPLPSAPTLLLS